MSTRAHGDLAKLQGTWQLVSIEMDGAEQPTAPIDATITVSGSTFATHGMGEDYAGTLEIVAGKTSNGLDLDFTAGPPSGMRNRAIYTLDGDTWTICIATRGDARPKRFATRADTGLALEIFQRAKTNKRAPKTAAAPQLDSASVDPSTGSPTEIEGEWPMVSAVIDGKPLADDMVKWCKRVTRGNVTKILAGPQTMLDAEFTLDASQTPRHIDYLNRSGKNKGKRQAGIYEITGDTLRICTSAPGKPRPADFSSSNGDGRSFTVWQRR